MISGVKQWVFQRSVNAVIVLSAIALFLTLFCGITYEELTWMLSQVWFKLIAIVVLGLACVNSVLAGWQIVGDYADKFNLSDTVLMVGIVGVTAVFFVSGLLLFI